MTKQLTVGDLRRLTAGLSDDLPVWVAAEAEVDGDVDTLHAWAEDAAFRPKEHTSIFAGPPVDRFVIYADGVPGNVCRECAQVDGEHPSWCTSKGEESSPEEAT